jgi:hypothetical protein
MKTEIFAICLLSIPQLALADETWSSNQMGDITFVEDRGTVAVLSMAGSHPGSTVNLYVEGLGGNLAAEGTFSGYWIENAPGECATERTGADDRGHSPVGWVISPILNHGTTMLMR